MQEPGGKPNGKFEGIIKKLGITVPAGQEPRPDPHPYQSVSGA